MGQLNQRQQAEIQIKNFSGGHTGAKAIGNLELNEAQDLDNIVVLPAGSGFRNRNGNDQHILTDLTGQDSKDEVVGLYFLTIGGVDVLTRFNLGGTTSNELEVSPAAITDKTTAGTSSAYPSSTYTLTKNDTLMLSNYENGILATTNQYIPFLKAYVALSGSDYFPTVSIGVSGTPNGKVSTIWNNRAWVGNLLNDKSKLQYSILLSSGVDFNTSATWSDAGSGFVNPNRGDGDELVALSPISNNILLFFKKKSIYQVVGRSDPFAVFNLFEGIGCVGRHAVINVDGLVYFITPDRRMAMTDGSKVLTDKDIPEFGYADDLWDSVVDSRLEFTYGFRQRGQDFDWLVWLVTTTGTTHNKAIIWDLRNKCWLQASTGYNANCAVTHPNGTSYIGTYTNAGLFELNKVSKYDDDSHGTETFNGSGVRTGVTDAQAVAWKWRSDDYAISMKSITQVKEINVLTKYGANGNLDLNYRYDGQADSTDITKAVVPSTLNHTSQVFRPLGRGDTFGFELNSNSAVSAKVSKVTIVGSQKGTKDPGTV